jgi:hypothetical protein
MFEAYWPVSVCPRPGRRRGAVTQAGGVLQVETVRKTGLDHATMIRSRMYVLLGEVL